MKIYWVIALPLKEEKPKRFGPYFSYAKARKKMEKLVDFVHYIDAYIPGDRATYVEMDMGDFGVQAMDYINSL